MNTNQLKKMAAAARQQLLSGIQARLHYVLNTDSAEIREQQRARQELQRALEREGEAALVERIAYTWFNRLVALRFMDVNDYQPSGIRVVSPREGFTRPQLLEEARAGRLPAELPVDTQLINDLLDGRRPSKNAENEVYRLLLMAACNQLHQTFPFLFEPLADYTELLLPEDVISPASILHQIREGLPAEDCQEVEVLGWLYQFYIAEKKDAVFAKKGKVTAAEIPAATQLFTPRWIVEYMVQNSLGRLWLQSRPQSGLRAQLPYYLENPETSPAEAALTVDRPEEIRLLDPACGSGHILIYAFELLSKIYEEEGYAPSEIAPLILEHNLYGLEIDQRAAQLAAFALLMKARSYHRRALRKVPKPQIIQLQPIPGTEEQLSQALQQAGLMPEAALLHDLQLMREADNYGSLIIPTSHAAQRAGFRQKVEQAIPQQPLLSGDLQALVQALNQLDTLGQAYHCVVANPPYMGSGKMNKKLSTFVKKWYKNSKSDLMTCFIEANLERMVPNGFLGTIILPSWLFLSSFEKIRKKVIEETYIQSLLHMGRGIFGIDWGSSAFVLENRKPTNTPGKYFRLHERNFQHIYPEDIRDIFLRAKEDSQLKIDFTKYRDKGEVKDITSLISDEGKQIAYTARQRDFGKIPGSPVGYWLGDKTFIHFEKNGGIGDYFELKAGLQTGNNDHFLRFYWEVNYDSKHFVKYDKGGPPRRWYGNNLYLIYWKNDAELLKNSGKAVMRNSHFYYKEGISYSLTSSSFFCARFRPEGFIFDNQGSSLFEGSPIPKELALALLNSKVSLYFTKILNPTLVTQVGDLARVPFLDQIKKINVLKPVKNLIRIAKEDWDANEISWDFKKNELLKHKAKNLKESLSLFSRYWNEMFSKLHEEEEMLDQKFIEMYELENELSPKIPLQNITILQKELNVKKLNILNESLHKRWYKREGRWLMNESSVSFDLPFDKNEIMSQFVSYAVGCMFGRYSLDKEGLILANQGEEVADFVRKVSGAWWMVDGEGNWKIDPDKDVYEHYPELKKEEDPTTTHQPPSTKNHPPPTTYQKPSTTHHPPITFMPDEDNIIPVLDEEWFEDDIVSRFRAFLRASFGEEHFHDNLAFLEECLGTDIRSWLVKKFYPDHIKRYKKRPIYWLFASPSGAFQALIYLHRYTPDTLNNLLNNYLRVYMDKLRLRLQELAQVEVDPRASAGEKSRARKQMNQYKSDLDELETWEREVVYPLASERIAIDLDDGVLVNYNKFGRAVQEVRGLNDAKAKKKVRGFDWIDTAGIR